jgi:hypothetical protein
MAADLALVPLLFPERAPPTDADLLEEGIARGDTLVTEISHNGSVNAVKVLHRGGKPLLLLDGEEIVGAKQNRVFNASFLVLKDAEVELPVSCVERGRWRHNSDAFRGAERTVASGVRGAKVRRTHESLATKGSYDANQGEVWKDVDGYLAKTGVRSGTAAFSDGHGSQAQRVERELAKLQVLADQVGLAAVRGKTLVVIDLFGSPALFARAWPKIARGILGEIWDAPETTDPAAALDVVAAALREVAAVETARTPAPGAGETLHGKSERRVLAALAHEGTLYHAVVV